MEGDLRCPSCSASNPEGQRFCGVCGTRLAQVCPSCGIENPLSNAFCGSCGTRLEATDAETTPREAAPAREERRHATVMFADLSGFTSLSERMDPEDVKELGAQLTSQMGAEVARFGGTVVSVMGDAVMGVFGAPVAHEDDAERAVRCALAMMDSVVGPPTLTAPVRLHIGINTGLVMAGLVGPDAHREYSVMGDVTNTAARLQSAAKPGEILTGRATRDATAHAIRYEDAGTIEAKGKQEPVETWRVLGISARPGTRPGSTGPLVGRGVELDMLERMWDQVVATSRPALVTVFGPPGIGKSRLAREFATRAAGDARVIAGRSLPYGEATGYDAFGSQVRAAAGILEADPAPEAFRKLAERVATLPLEGSATGEVAGHLAILLGLPAEGAPDKQILLASARSFVEALGREEPTVLAFEDLHWAQGALLDLIELLAQRVRESAVLLLGTARPDLLGARPSWGGGLARYTAIDLNPLGDEDAHLLARSLLPEDRSGSLERLVDAGGGNPLFLEELVAAEAEHELGAGSPMPTTVQAIIAARLDALPDRERRVVEAAAVAGRFFWRGALAALAGEDDLDDALDSLEARDLIRRRPASIFAGDPEFLFKHVLIREVAYETLPRAARRPLHAEVAAHLEETLGDRVPEQASLVAHHWTEAGEPVRAAPYLLLAAEAASRTWAKERAIELFGTVAGIAERQGDERMLEQALLGRARALLDSNMYGPEAEGDIDRVIGLATGRNEVVALQLRGRLYYWRADSAATRTAARQAAELARELGEPELEARALAMLSEVAGMDGDMDVALDLSDRAMTMWPESETTRDSEYAYSSTQRGIIHYWTGAYEDALRWSKIGYQQGLDASTVYATLNGAAHTGLALVGLSRHEEAFDWFQRAAATGREWEPIPRFTARALNMWAGALREIGDLAASREMSLEAREMGRTATFPGATISAGIDLAVLDMLEGDLGNVERALPGLLAAAAEAKGWHEWLFGGRLAEARARLELLSGRPEEAVATAREALARALENHRVKYACRSRIVLGDALVASGHPAEAAEAFRAAVDDADRLGHAPSRWAALAGLAEALGRSAKDEEAGTAAEHARRTIDGFATSLTDEHRRGLLESLEGTPAGRILG